MVFPGVKSSLWAGAEGRWVRVEDNVSFKQVNLSVLSNTGEKPAKCVQVLCSREEGAPFRALLWNVVQLPTSS